MATRRTGLQFNPPGSCAPCTHPHTENLQAWLQALAFWISPQRLRGEVEALPVPHNFARGDRVPFWEAGTPAIQVTDTANIRYRHYHQPSDTPKKLDYRRLADIVGATALAIARTAELLL